MSASRQAVANLGGETTPTSILLHCQQEVYIITILFFENQNVDKKRDLQQL